ncbi:hypothetical protein [Thermomonospora cellulosilytica]|uniref:Type I restriction enzyme S subunit n=1 Tax=Thermomonospora cellulosilytica TaxID=1411118 RepID=A0A7W3MSL9_9ACTN|nr:hypothetical protein [Thermomonospora cellulosilytica]MBA9001160.1 type I restriction enzyme S subunit [Thermomonospora cellulosilytica]
MNVVALGEIIKPAQPPRAGDGEYPILSITMRHGLVDQEEKFKKRVASADLSAYKVVTRGQLVVGFPIDEGVLAFQNKYPKAVVSPAYSIWDLIAPDRVNRNYLQRYLRSPRALSYYVSRLRGTTARRRSLPQDVFLALPVPMPGRSEQDRIVSVLDQADRVRERRRGAIDLLDELARSIFLDMFGDPIKNPHSWPVWSFGDLLDMPPRNGVSPSSDGSVQGKVLTLSAITGSRFNDKSVKSALFYMAPPARQSVDSRDLLICRGSGNIALVGRGFFPSRSMVDVTFPDTVIAARVDRRRLLPNFIESLWGMPFVRRQIESVARTTSGIYKINQKMVEAVRVIVPPLDLQEQFSSRVEAVRRLEATHRAHLAGLDELFGSLQQRAFRGDL